MRAFLLILSTFGSLGFADTNSDLYMACPKQRDAINKFTGGTANECQSTLAKAAKCCNLFPGCEVRGVDATATNGNIQGGQLLIAALQARIAGIDKNMHNCGEASLSADLPCYSEKFNATSADKQLKIKFNSAVGDLAKCMAEQKALAAKQMVQAGGSVSASGGPRYGNDVTEQQILQQLRGQQGK